MQMSFHLDVQNLVADNFKESIRNMSSFHVKVHHFQE